MQIKKQVRAVAKFLILCGTLATCMSSRAEDGLSSTPAANVSLEQAERILAGAIAYAKKINTAMAVVIVDSAGHVVLGARMTGVPFGTFDVARGKAIASVATGGVSGRALMDRYKANPIVFGQISSLSYGGPMFPSQGSLPIYLDGMLIGSVPLLILRSFPIYLIARNFRSTCSNFFV